MKHQFLHQPIEPDEDPLEPDEDPLEPDEDPLEPDVDYPLGLIPEYF
jgi:hypothetical protein